MNLIAAVDQNWALGSKNNLLFRIKADLQRFKALTTGKVVIYGRKTLATFPGQKPLPNRLNIILSRQQDLQVDDALICHEKDELLELCCQLQAEEGFLPAQFFVIGGAQIYEMLLPYCFQAYITYIHDLGSDPDSFLPRLDRMPNWALIEQSDILKEQELAFDYRIYRQII